MKYAIIQISGKQLLIKAGQWYDIDFIKKSNASDKFFFNKILLFKKNDTFQLGHPFLDGVKISALILRNVKGRKITVLKTKPKKKYTRTKGHRGLYTRVQINSLN